MINYVVVVMRYHVVLRGVSYIVKIGFSICNTPCYVNMTNPTYQIEILNKEDCGWRGCWDSKGFEGIGWKEGIHPIP